ncbi:MAG TPA: hypothetical protein VNO21_04245, partial [Polyangiaceae bacterium]|nr:hypothetical protein [Polyangiaceae bacterium]
RAPCNMDLATSSDYRVRGGGRRESKAFSLRGSENERVEIRVHGGSTPLYVLGWCGVGTGGAVGLFGFGLLLGTITPGPEGRGSLIPDVNVGLAVSLFAVGAAVATAGVVLIKSERVPNVVQEVHPLDEQRAPADAWLRLPGWRERTPAERAMPPSLGVPLLHARF